MSKHSILPQSETLYLQQIVSILQARLAERLVGVYLFGSAAYGDYEPPVSDLDVQAVVSESLSLPERRDIAGSLAHGALPCPARRLEFVCYAQAAIDPATRHPQFELNFNTGSDMDDHLSLDPAEESSHWFLLDIAIGRELGRSLLGPEPAQVFAAIPRLWQLEAIHDSLAWHHQHDFASANSVLNACRSWRYAATGCWGSKIVGAAWAREHSPFAEVIDQAMQRRHGGPPLAGAAIVDLIATTSSAVQMAILQEQS